MNDSAPRYFLASQHKTTECQLWVGISRTLSAIATDHLSS